MSGYKITEWNADKLLTQATAVNVKAMHRAALIVEVDIKRNFTRQGTGRIYGRHQASRPGRPPAIDTGMLRASIQNKVIKDVLSVNGYVFSDVKYAPHLELGTTKMARRPFLRPSLARNRKKINKIFREANK